MFNLCFRGFYMHTSGARVYPVPPAVDGKLPEVQGATKALCEGSDIHCIKLR